jgi:PIN domain nuclease of toxin-antitoxin system
MPGKRVLSALLASSIMRLRVLAAHHRDPFDRLLVAQAIEERLTIVTHID